jgi:xylose isomerase
VSLIERFSCTGTLILFQTIIKQGGIQPGGLNFDCKVRRESIDVADMFIAHIGAMDTFARGLKYAARIIEEGVLDDAVKVSLPSSISHKQISVDP